MVKSPFTDTISDISFCQPSVFDRYGLVPRSSPRQADPILIAGTVTMKMTPSLVRLYEQMPDQNMLLLWEHVQLPEVYLIEVQNHDELGMDYSSFFYGLINSTLISCSKMGQRRKRMRWFQELHNQFLEFVKLLGGPKTRFDDNSELVAELVTTSGFKASYAIKDKAEGSR
ncbi:hypothetical protein M9H77_31441 [Catharanthus roseus]|uniref:Uncharacterized protein n=1 Tax=Catharanthus roseus TaxID=4058 RepID=A0ACC0A259_CATRO|nr:hypothetical protein M9H77_31441 [Catharanthus roseus]